MAAVALGQGDDSLRDLLWDGDSVRIVDFEGSEPSTVAFETAPIMEHVSGWSAAGWPGDDVLKAGK